MLLEQSLPGSAKCGVCSRFLLSLPSMTPSPSLFFLLSGYFFTVITVPIMWLRIYIWMMQSLGNFFVHSSAFVCIVPLKQFLLLLPASHLGRQQTWQVYCADKTPSTSATWHGSRDFYFVSLLLFYVITQIRPEGDLRKLSGSFLCSGQDQIHPALFGWCFVNVKTLHLLNLFLKSCIAASSQIPGQPFSVLSWISPLHMIRNT